MTTMLKNLSITEISLVKRPANKEARVLVFKHAVSAPLTETKNVFSVEQTEDNMTAFTKGEADLDALVSKRREQHEDESEAVAMARVLQTLEGKTCYARMSHAKDLEIAKGSTMLTFEHRNIEKIGGHSVAERTSVTDALEKLDAMAKAEASKTGQTYFQAYARILATETGKALYSAACAKPSLA